MRTVILLVIDGLGVGALPDAADYGDSDSNTLKHAAAAGTLRTPHLNRLGLSAAAGISAEPAPDCLFGRMAELSAGKDSMIGHWEMAGIVTARPFPTYPDGFPPSIQAEIERTLGTSVLGNVAGSGTVLIEEFGARSMATGCPILYTSSDSVLQLAAHVEITPPDILYSWCEMLRLMMGDRVARIIARPFTGFGDRFKRLDDQRRDWPLEAPGPNLLDVLDEADIEAVAIGKVLDLFAGEGFSHFEGHNTDQRVIEHSARWARQIPAGLVWANCEEADTRYAHRNDPQGWCQKISALDDNLEQLTSALGTDDVLIVCGDHGNDPTTPSTDHSREYVPVLATTGGHWRSGSSKPVDIGTRESFADVGATVAELLTGVDQGLGESFAEQILS